MFNTIAYKGGFIQVATAGNDPVVTYVMTAGGMSYYAASVRGAKCAITRKLGKIGK